LTQARRAFLKNAFCGFGSLALASLLHEQGTGASRNPLAAKLPPKLEGRRYFDSSNDER